MSNLVLQAQVIVGPLNLSQVNFNYLLKVTPDSLNFNVYNPNGEDQERFQREWKQLVDFFIPTGLEVKDEDVEGSIDLEEISRERPQKEEVPIGPIDQLTEKGN